MQRGTGFLQRRGLLAGTARHRLTRLRHLGGGEIRLFGLRRQAGRDSGDPAGHAPDDRPGEADTDQDAHDGHTRDDDFVPRLFDARPPLEFALELVHRGLHLAEIGGELRCDLVEAVGHDPVARLLAGDHVIEALRIRSGRLLQRLQQRHLGIVLERRVELLEFNLLLLHQLHLRQRDFQGLRRLRRAWGRT